MTKSIIFKLTLALTATALILFGVNFFYADDYQHKNTYALPGSDGVHHSIGFFTPDGVKAEVVGKVNFLMVNAASLDHLVDNLKLMAGSTSKIYIDFGPVLAAPKNSSEISLFYKNEDGVAKSKLLSPLNNTKLRSLPNNAEVKRLLTPYLDKFMEYQNSVGAVFIADEPYLNGIDKKALERVAAVVRHELDERGLKHIKIGVIFASALFNAQFAELIDSRSVAYVQAIDEYYLSGRADDSWKSFIKKSRLSTYDSAGNMYTAGGIPKGFDIVGFNFYVSTLLLDSVHEMSMAFFAQEFPKIHACGRFKQEKISTIRKNLSFFKDGPVIANQVSDAEIMDGLFTCRMNAVMNLFKMDPASHSVDFMMISESSNNGVLEFNSSGEVEKGQPSLLIEARVLDEVRRANRFYSDHQKEFKGGLMYFTYENTYDNTINLHVGGASSMPSVMDYIFSSRKPR